MLRADEWLPYLCLRDARQDWRGSYEGWMPSLGAFMNRMSKILPGLDNLYMAGQWVEPGGGLPTAAMSGRNVIQIICKRDKRPFVTVKP